MIQAQAEDCGTDTLVQEHKQVNEVRPPAKDHTALLMRLALLCVSGFAMFYSLGERLLRTWDEAIYAEVAREMLSLHSWLTPYWNFQPWFEKPPLFMWLTALMYRLFGVSELSARAVGALCGVATILLTFELGRRLMDDWSGLAAAAILLTNGYFIYISRFSASTCQLSFVSPWWRMPTCECGKASRAGGTSQAHSPG